MLTDAALLGIGAASSGLDSVADHSGPGGLLDCGIDESLAPPSARPVPLKGSSPEPPHATVTFDVEAGLAGATGSVCTTVWTGNVTVGEFVCVSLTNEAGGFQNTAFAFRVPNRRAET